MWKKSITFDVEMLAVQSLAIFRLPVQAQSHLLLSLGSVYSTQDLDSSLPTPPPKILLRTVTDQEGTNVPVPALVGKHKIFV